MLNDCENRCGPELFGKLEGHPGMSVLELLHSPLGEV